MSEVKEHRIDTGYNCYCCGSGVVQILTDAEQPDDLASGAFMCFDADDAVCGNCGFLHRMSADVEGVELTWDESLPENLAAWEKVYHPKTFSRTITYNPEDADSVLAGLRELMKAWKGTGQYESDLREAVEKTIRPKGTIRDPWYTGKAGISNQVDSDG